MLSLFTELVVPVAIAVEIEIKEARSNYSIDFLLSIPSFPL